MLPQTVKKSRAFYGNWRIIIVFTTASFLSLFWARLIQSMPLSHVLKIHFNIILPDLQTGLFPSGFHTKSIYEFLLSPVCVTCPAHLILFDLINRIMFGEEYCSLSSPLYIYIFFSLFCYLVPLRPKYLPQHPTLEHSQLMFLPHCERPSFIHIKYNIKFTLLYTLILVFLGNILVDGRFWRQQLIHLWKYKI
jgi:hypothetical protein